MNQLCFKASLVVIVGWLVSSGAHAADPLPPETRLVAASGAPAATESTFMISAAVDLVVTFTDLKIPAALASASIVITQADQIVGQASLAPPATTATVALSAATGQYTLRVIGAPDPTDSVGTFTVCVAPKASPSNCIQSASLSGNISAQSTASNKTVSTLSAQLTVTTAGPYTFTFGDFKFPAILQTAPTLALFQGSLPIALGIVSGSSLPLSPGTYELLAVAQADAATQAGLYGITVTGPAGVAALFNDAIPVGLTPPYSAPNNPSAQTLSLQLTDFAFPAPLTQASAVVTAGGTLLGTASTTGSAQASFAAPAGPLKVWTYAAAGSDAGTYGVSLSAGPASLFSTALAVNAGPSLAYAFVTPALTAGAYQATASDFEFPSTLQALKFEVVQNGVVLNQSNIAGSVNIAAAAGPVIVLVDAVPPASGNGLFGITVQAAGTSGAVVFDKAQGASATGLFDSQDIVLGTSGDYNVSLADLKFPAQFQNLALVVSHAGKVLGKIYGGGTFTISATPGTYELAFIATPAANQQYGLYSTSIVPSLPTITLTASPTTVVAGALTQLNWTTMDATSCTGSGGNWSGTKAVNSGAESVRVDASVTYTLSCTGPGGTAQQTVMVTATPKPASSGGGSTDLMLLLGLAAIWLAAQVGRHINDPRR